jgi:hypothetical protein
MLTRAVLLSCLTTLAEANLQIGGDEGKVIFGKGTSISMAGTCTLEYVAGVGVPGGNPRLKSNCPIVTQEPLESCVPNGDFEASEVGEGEASGTWTKSGTAFDNWPWTNCGNSGNCFGKGLSTLRNGESAVGTLTSQEFTISKNKICMQVGGFTQSGVKVKVGDDVVATHEESIGDTFQERCMDVSGHIGQNARIEIWDSDTNSGSAWFAVDSFECRD